MLALQDALGTKNNDSIVHAKFSGVPAVHHKSHNTYSIDSKIPENITFCPPLDKPLNVLVPSHSALMSLRLWKRLLTFNKWEGTGSDVNVDGCDKENLRL